MAQCSTDLPRVNSDGLLVEGERVNQMLRTEDMTNGSWTKAGGAVITGDTHASPWGTTVMDTETGGVTYESLTFSSRTGPFTLSAFGRAVSGTHAAGLDLYISAGSISGCVCRSFDGTACTLTLLAGDCIGDWTFTTTARRLEISTSSAAATALLAVLDSGPVGGPGGAAHVWTGAQVESPAAFASSYIPTTGTTASRSADDVHYAPSRSLDTAGCVRATVKFPPVVAVGMRVLGGTTDTAPIYVASATELAISDGTNTATIDVGALAGASMTIRAGWGGSALVIETATDVATGTFDGNMSMGTIYLGSQEGTSNFLYGYLKDIRFGTTSAGCTL
jgi:hypothetical protein